MIYYKIDPSQSEFESFVQEIARHFENEGTVITDNRNSLKILTHHNRKVVVKSFKIPNLINRFAYRYIRGSKAKRSFENARKLLKLGIATPQPIAFVEFFTPLLEKSFYISDYFPFDFEIRALLNNPDFPDRWRILEAFVAFSYALHQKGVYHIDYSPGNVLIKKENQEYHFSLVDVNRMKFITFDNALRFKNLSRFSASEEDTDFIARYYAAISGIDEQYAVNQLRHYHQKHQRYLQNKKRMKKIPV